MAPGQYAVTVTDGGCSDETSYQLSRIDKPVVGLLANSTCTDEEITMTASGDGLGAYTHTWSILGSNSNTFTSNISQDVEVTFTLSNASCEFLYNTIIEVEECIVCPNGLTVNLPETYVKCDNGPITLTASASDGAGGYEYTWSDGSQGESIEVNPSTTSTYTVVVTDSDQCTAEAETEVVVVTKPEGYISMGTSSELCLGSSITLNAIGFDMSNTTDFQWISTRGTSLSNVTPLSVDCNFAEIGNQTITLSYTHKGCNFETNVSIDIIDCCEGFNPTISGDQDLCHGETTTLTVSSKNGVSYEWTKDGVTLELENANTLANAGPGTYQVFVTSTDCSGPSNSYVVTSNPLTEIEISMVGQLCIDDATSQVILNVSPDDIQYTWDHNASGASITILEPGTYTVNGTDVNGCPVSGFVEIDEVLCCDDTYTTAAGVETCCSEISVSIIGEDVVCPGQNVVLQADVIFPGDPVDIEYLWNPTNHMKNKITVGYGEYTLSVNIGSCQPISVTHEVEEIHTGVCCTTVSASLSAESMAICAGQTTYITASPTGTDYSYEWEGVNIYPGNTQNQKVVGPGEYTVTVTDVNNCTGVASITVEEIAKPAAPDITCYQTAEYNTSICDWVVSGEEPDCNDNNPLTTDGYNAVNCECVNTLIPVEGCTDPCAINYDPNANIEDESCQFDPEPIIECYETSTFDDAICDWVVSGSQPVEPTIDCYETSTFDDAICDWVVSGTQPVEPTIACYETSTFDDVACAWVVSGTQPEEPTIECYETATFDDVACAWVVSGTQPEEPTVECYETATFDNASCEWVVVGEQPTEPSGPCVLSATFNTTFCAWDIEGSAPPQPSTACYEMATFDNVACNWIITGEQPTEPNVECYEIATFDYAICEWVVVGEELNDYDCDNGICSDGLETWDGCECIDGTPPQEPAGGCDDEVCSNGIEEWDGCDCVRIWNKPPDCNDGICDNGMEVWNNNTCECESGKSKADCIDDNICSNGVEYWNSLSCSCEQIHIPDPNGCVNDGDCSNGIEVWDSNTCNCHQINIPDPTYCIDDGDCSNGIETWNNITCECENLTPSNDPCDCADLLDDNTGEIRVYKACNDCNCDVYYCTSEDNCNIWERVNNGDTFVWTYIHANGCETNLSVKCHDGNSERIYNQSICMGSCIPLNIEEGYTYQWLPDLSQTTPCPDSDGIYTAIVTAPDGSYSVEEYHITIEQPPTIILKTRNCTLDDPEDCTCVLEAYSAVDASGNPIEVKPYLESDGRTWTVEVPYGNKCVLKESSTCIQNLGPRDDDDKIDHNNLAPDTPQIDLEQSEDKKTLYIRSNIEGKLRASLHDTDDQEILHVDLEASSQYEMVPIDMADIPPGKYDIRITDAHGDMLYTERIAIPRAETLSPQSRDYPTRSGSNNK